MAHKFVKRFRGGFTFGFLGTFAIIDPSIPVLLRSVLAALLLLGTSGGVAEVLYRLAGKKVFAENSKWGQTIEGIGGGTGIMILS